MKRTLTPYAQFSCLSYYMYFAFLTTVHIPLFEMCIYSIIISYFAVEYYERLFKDVQNQSQVEGVTGLLLLFPKYCIHVVEVRANTYDSELQIQNVISNQITLVLDMCILHQYHYYMYRVSTVLECQGKIFKHIKVFEFQ